METVNAKRIIQDYFLNGKKDIGKDELEKLGFDISKSILEVNNIKMDRSYGTYYLSIIDKQKDLDGNLICNHYYPTN